MKSAQFAPRGLSRALLIVALGGLALTAPQAASTARESTPAVSGQEQIAGIRPETRLRKLHLVRPDLVPYPIAYEVYC